MPEKDDFRPLMERLHRGDRQAASAVVARFADRLTAVASRYLHPRLRPKLDPEDVAQAAFQNFFEQCTRGELRLEGWDDLWALMVVIAQRRCAWEGRYHLAARRDVRRESDRHPDSDELSFAESFAATEPAPDNAAILAETFENLLNRLSTDDQEVVMHALHGCTVPEISRLTGRTSRTVYRVLHRLKEMLHDNGEAVSA